MEAETSAANAPASAASDTPVTMKKMIMVAIDESEESFYALKWALDNLINDPSIIITFQCPTSFYPHVVFAAPTVVEAVKKGQHENATRILSRALHLCKQKMVKAETLILDGDPKDMICQAAHELHADLLVVGSRGLGKIKRAFLGSVSDYCAHHVQCPILIVKPSKEIPKSS
ncbi:hypothetical protein KY285_003802 [Solanum tuberosum]|nr:hypothetical protein KY285_003802 [Solanum tuberosum]